ncbi:MAG TPA: hypothetical protein VK524_13670, partial [Polyangiaceae bacterium]|nr:hypothetical protein [Polyangiaceae bacterium]
MLVAVALLRAAAASAQVDAALPAPATDAAAEEARTAFAEGLRYLRTEQWAQAEAAFKRSLELVPRASTRYNLALVLFKQRRARESLSGIDELLASQLGPGDERYHEYARTLRSLVIAELAQVRVGLEPSNAVLEIDGERVPATGSPRQVWLEPGPHRVQVAASGYAQQSALLNAARGEEQRWDFKLRLQQSAPSGARKTARTPAPSANTRNEHRQTAAHSAASTFSRVAPWVTVGAGALLLAGGVVAGVRAKNADDDFVEACPTLRNCDPDLQETEQDAQRQARLSTVLFAAGGALVTGGIIWHVLTP